MSHSPRPPFSPFEPSSSNATAADTGGARGVARYPGGAGAPAARDERTGPPVATTHGAAPSEAAGGLEPATRAPDTAASPAWARPHGNDPFGPPPGAPAGYVAPTQVGAPPRFGAPAPPPFGAPAPPPQGAPGVPPFGGAPFAPSRGPSGLNVAIVLIGLAAAAGLVLVMAAGLGAYVYVRAKASAAAASSSTPVAPAYGNDVPWDDSDAAVPASSRDPSWGARTAPVTVVAFEDFQCPFCARLRPTLAAVKERYGPNKVRVVWKHYPLPFHANARPAALAAEAAFRLGGSRAFWAFHDAAFANQSDLTQANYERWAAEAGVDLPKFRALQVSPAVGAKVDADASSAAAVGAQGTPNLFINGTLVAGAQPLETLTGVIDAEFAAAARALAGGTPADRVYFERSHANKAKNPTAGKRDAAAPDDDKVYDVPAGDSPSRGPASAKVTIVVFADFQCPFCARATPTLERVRETYGDKVRVVWKNNPLAFHQRAAPAAELALEARAQRGDDGFWAAHDLLFKNQSSLSEDDLLRHAAALKLDVARVRKALARERHKAVIDADQRLAERVSARGTPTFFINGHKLTGAQPFERFKALIDREFERPSAPPPGR
jgi:protein-disulfide isomerase